MVVTCDTKSSDEMVHTKTEYLCVLRPSAGTASGLLECVKHAIYDLGITEIITAQLVGFCTDGAAANIYKQGLKGLVEKGVFWMWCLAHRLELSVKDSLTGTVQRTGRPDIRSWGIPSFHRQGTETSPC